MKLSEADVVANVAVKDAELAKKFYGEILGLKLEDESMGAMTYKSGSAKMIVYTSDTAGSGKATAASWAVEDIDAVVKELKDKGVSFEKYNIPNATQEGDIAVIGEFKATWFKDPDGNILSIMQMS